MAIVVAEATDRKTGRPIKLMQVNKDDLPYLWNTRTMWVWADVPWEEMHGVLLKRDHHYNEIKPREFCWYTTHEGEDCMVKVKLENQRAGLFACGRHMSNFQADLAAERKREETAVRRAAQEEALKAELVEYERAYDMLKAEGFGIMLGERPRLTGYGYQRIDNQYAEQDLIVLAKELVPDFITSDDKRAAEMEQQFPDFVAVGDDFFED